MENDIYKYPFENIEVMAEFLREDSRPKYSIIFAHNGTGKTRLSMKFKDVGKRNSSDGHGDTLYFNAYTEDLFYWDNDLDNDSERFLMFNKKSHFFDGIYGYDIESKIAPILQDYVNLFFKIDVENGKISFSRNELDPVDNQLKPIEHIKISRGEETVFIWCFFLAIVDMIGDNPNYDFVKYIYVDDPVSSLDDNYVISIATVLCQKLKEKDNIKVVVSSHHGLFFNVMCNNLDYRRNKRKSFENRMCYFLTKDEFGPYVLTDTTEVPFFHHLVLIHDLNKAVESGNLYTYHFNILRTIMEKTAVFFGYEDFSDCIERFLSDDNEKKIYKRMLNIFSHANYSLFSPNEMSPNNKDDFKLLFEKFKEVYKFNDKKIELLEYVNVNTETNSMT